MGEKRKNPREILGFWKGLAEKTVRNVCVGFVKACKVRRGRKRAGGLLFVKRESLRKAIAAGDKRVSAASPAAVDGPQNPGHQGQEKEAAGCRGERSPRAG